MAFLSSLNIAASGMAAERLRLDVISQNVANAKTTRTEDGTPVTRTPLFFVAETVFAGTPPAIFSFLFAIVSCQPCCAERCEINGADGTQHRKQLTIPERN